jgi:hypothetical protein
MDDPILPEMYPLQARAIDLAGFNRYRAAEQLALIARDLLEEIRAPNYSIAGPDGIAFLPGPVELNAAIECLRSAALALGGLLEDVVDR